MITLDEYYALRPGDRVELDISLGYTHREHGYKPGEIVLVTRAAAPGLHLKCCKLDKTYEVSFVRRRFARVVKDDIWSIWDVR